MPLKVDGLTSLLQVYDMPTAIHFYREVLGFAIVGHSPLLSDNQDDFHWGMLRRDETELMLNTAYDEGERPAVPDPARVSAHGDVTLYFDCPDVDGAYRHLRELGVEAEKPVVTWYGMRQMSLKDPDGYGLCFQWPV